MPTTLPVRSVAPDPNDGLAGFMRALLRIYGVAAVLFLALAAVEAHFGMFKDLTFAESILEATGTDLPVIDDEVTRVVLIPSP